MKTMVFITLFAAISMTAFSQKQLILHGKIDLSGKNRKVHIWGYDELPVNTDGSFELSAEIKHPGIAFIQTDSSAATVLWLEPGEYTIHCKEIKMEKIKQPIFSISLLKGPADAVLYNDFQLQLLNQFGISGQPGEDQGSAREQRKKRVAEYMDSVIRLNNASPVLAHMVRSSQFYVGDELSEAFVQKLSPALRSTDEIVILENSFKRKQKISKEKVFENFILRNLQGKDFSLASLSGKKAVLIDFWASSCGPCRAGHPKLKEWYQKYADKGLEIVSVSIDDDKIAWQNAVKADGIENWVNVCDFKGWKADLIRNYYIPYIPFRFLLDEKKNIVLVENMQDSWITEKDIAALLSK